MCEDFDIVLDDVLEENLEDDDFMGLDDPVLFEDLFDVTVFEGFDVFNVLSVIFEDSFCLDVSERDLVSLNACDRDDFVGSTSGTFLSLIALTALV